MIKTSFKKIIPTLLIVYAVCFAGLLIFYLFLPPTIVLPGFKVNYIFNVTFLSFLKFLIPINCTGLLIAYSLVLTPEDMISIQGTTRPFHSAVTPLLVVLLIFSIVYTILFTWSYSFTWTAVRKAEQDSRVFNSYFDKAKEANSLGNHREALNYLKACFIIDAKNERAVKFQWEIEEYLHENNIAYEEKDDFSQDSIPQEKMDIEEIMRKANDFFYKQDWFSSYYYASLAYSLDPERLDAQKQASEALAKIRADYNTIEDDRILKLFTAKQEAYNALIVKRDYISAYFQLKKLKKEAPGDRDIESYFIMAENKLKEYSFFVEDIQIPLTLPGVEELFFRNLNTEKEVEFIYIKKMVYYNDMYFFKDIEVLRFSPSGKILFHQKAPYGKYFYADVSSDDVETGDIKEHYINMKCYSRDNDKILYEPVLLEGQTGALGNFVILSPSLEQLPDFSGHKDRYTDIGLTDLFLIREYVGQFGYPLREIEIEIVTRLLYPFMFLILSIFSISLGWSYRSRYEKTLPIGIILLLPVFPFVVAAFVNIFLFINRLFYIIVLNAAGYLTTLLLGGLLQFVLLSVAIIILAGQITEK